MLESFDEKSVIAARKAPGRQSVYEISFTQETIHDEIVRQRKYFDVVRLVDPVKTTVCDVCAGECEGHACYSVWENVRCNNCISMIALREKSRSPS